MPEGHTLFRLARDLTDAFGGSAVRVSSPQGRFGDAALVDGHVLTAAESAGKHLFVTFDDDRLIHVRLGLIGKFDVGQGPAPAPVGQVRLRIESGTAYADLRGATQCELVGLEKRRQIVAKLGPDPLRDDADPERAWRKIHGSERPIGQLLMDQEVLAGIGNVYRAEVLFRHGIHPRRPGRSLKRSQWDAIWADLIDLLAEGVRVGRIDTVRFDHTPEAMGRAPRVDDHGGEVYVYRRVGQPCLVCGTEVRKDDLAGRNSFWCPRCQPVFRSRTPRPA